MTFEFVKTYFKIAPPKLSLPDAIRVAKNLKILLVGQGFAMERKRAFQMKQRFERCKTPSGSVPISVIMGFDYPLGLTNTFLTADWESFNYFFNKYLSEKCTFDRCQPQTERRVGGGREGRPPIL